MTAYGRDFRSLRAWRGSQDQAFEELCYQLRDPTHDGAELVKTGNPDAGLEWYVKLRNGVQWGWQAKFTFNADTLLKLMERSLRTVVQRRPKCRRLTFCIPFDLPDAPEEGKRKSARQKFEDRKKPWRKRIPRADRVQIQLWSAGDLLDRLVGHPSQRGMEWFFWNREVFSLDWCAGQVATTVRAADERYSPKLHVDLPVAFALEGLARSEAYWQKYRALRGAVVIAASKIDVSHHTGIGVTTQLRNLVRCLTRWRQEVPSHVTLPARLDRVRLLAVTRKVHDAADVAYPSDPLRRNRRATERQLRTQERRYSLQHYLRALSRALEAFETLLHSRATEATERGALLLTGEAGQGKTHLFCDAAERAVETRQPAIVILAGRLSGRNVWSEITSQLGLGQVGSEVLIGGIEPRPKHRRVPEIGDFGHAHSPARASVAFTQAVLFPCDAEQGREPIGERAGTECNEVVAEVAALGDDGQGGDTGLRAAPGELFGRPLSFLAQLPELGLKPRPLTFGRADTAAESSRGFRPGGRWLSSWRTVRSSNGPAWVRSMPRRARTYWRTMYHRRSTALGEGAGCWPSWTALRRQCCPCANRSRCCARNPCPLWMTISAESPWA